MPRNDWETFFDYHAPVYMTNCFTGNTVAEVAFIVETLGVPPGGTILEIGCGTGRHTVELAKRGYQVTGVDLSDGMLTEAHRALDAAGVTAELVRMDATRFTAEACYDGAICICEGAFCLLGQDDDPITRDLAILRNIAGALKPGGRFLLTALSALRVIRAASEAEVQAGRFDPLTLVVSGDMTVETPQGPLRVPTRERHYVATELALLCRLAGFTVEHLGGGTAGQWGRRPLELDEYEIMAICRRAD